MYRVPTAAELADVIRAAPAIDRRGFGGDFLRSAATLLGNSGMALLFSDDTGRHLCIGCTYDGEVWFIGDQNRSAASILRHAKIIIPFMLSTDLLPKRLHAKIDMENHAAIRLAKRLGFRATGEICMEGGTRCEQYLLREVNV